MKPTISIIYNSQAGSGKNTLPWIEWFLGFKHKKTRLKLADFVTTLANELENKQYSVTLMPTQHAGHAKELARDVQSGIIIGVGGDGTLNEIVNGIQCFETVTLCPVPVGTANVLGVELKLGHSITNIVSAIENTQSTQVDLGVINDEHFLTMASVGFDAYIVEKVSQRTDLKKRFGAFSYIYLALKNVMRFRFEQVAYTIKDVLVKDGQSYAEPVVKGAANYVIVGNSKFYGGGFALFPEGSITDGRLDVCVIQASGLFSMLWFISCVKFSLKMPRYVTFFQCKSLGVNGQSIPAQIDGDFFGRDLFSISVERKKLKVIYHS